MGFVSLPVLRLSSDIVLNPGCSSLCVDHVISLRRTCAEQTSLHGAHSLVTCAFTMARTSLVLCFFVCIDLAHIRTKGTPKSRCSSKGRAAPAGTAGLHGCECWAVSADDVGFIHQVETGQLAPVVGSREECKGRAAAAGGTATEGRAAPAGTAGLHGCACWAVSADDVSFIHQVETDQLAPVVGSREECKGRAAAAGGTATEGRAAPAGTAGLHGCACWAVSADDVGSIRQVETGRHASIVGRRAASKGRAQLRQELRDYMVANAGQCPPTTSALYTKLRRAEMLRLLKDMLPRGQGPDTAPLDEQLRGGVFKFVADKTVLDCLPYLADLQVTAFQRYSQDAAADRRCCFADIVIAVSRGFEAAAFFSMQSLSVDDQTAALNWLETCPFATSDDTASVRARVESFCVAESRWPDKDGAHSLDRELVTAIGKVRSRRFGVVVNKRKGVLSDYALPLNEEQMLAWEALPLHSCFMWWPHHLKVFEEVQELWQNEQPLPVRGSQSASDALAQKVRRVRMKTLLTGRKAMRVAERITWEEAFPSIWQRRMQKEAYIQASQLTDSGDRWPFRRGPEATCMLACELCGSEMNTQREFLKHLEEHHVAADSAGNRADWWTPHRVVEEYRKRMMFYEQVEGG